MSDPQKEQPREESPRRSFLKRALAGCGVLALGGILAGRSGSASGEEMVWQIDPHKCVQCGKCATNCVLSQSAVRCIHSYAICGYCDLCMGYLEPEASARDTAAENQLCPTGAIKRTFIEDPYYEYTIDEPLCVGCGKCVKGCTLYGNGSLYLQIKHEICLHCNTCAIANACPADAFVRVPASQPYLLKDPGASAKPGEESGNKNGEKNA